MAGVLLLEPVGLGRDRPSRRWKETIQSSEWARSGWVWHVIIRTSTFTLRSSKDRQGCPLISLLLWFSEVCVGVGVFCGKTPGRSEPPCG